MAVNYVCKCATNAFYFLISYAHLLKKRQKTDFLIYSTGFGIFFGVIHVFYRVIPFRRLDYPQKMMSYPLTPHKLPTKNILLFPNS